MNIFEETTKCLDNVIKNSIYQGTIIDKYDRHRYVEVEASSRKEANKKLDALCLKGEKVFDVWKIREI